MTLNRQRRTPLILALLASALAHAVTMQGEWLPMPTSEPEARTLSATLKPMMPAPSAPVAAPVPVAKPRSAPARMQAAAAPPSLFTRADFTAPPLVETPAAPAPAVEAPAQPDASPASAPVAEQAPQPEPVVVATAAPTTLAAQPEAPGAPLAPLAIRSLPRKGRITYQLNYNLNGMPTQIGRTVQTWELDGNSYRFDSRSETTGLARLTRFGPRVFTSSGEITPQGLRPREFTSSVTVSGNVDNSAASFDWNTKQLQYGRAIDRKSAVLPPGAQDFVSFMYQLSLAPFTTSAGSRIALPVTNGARFEELEFDVRPEERIDTPLGLLRVVPVAQVRKGNVESMEVWLAAEYNYLPVRLRFIGRDGTPGGEQIVTDIRVGND